MAEGEGSGFGEGGGDGAVFVFAEGDGVANGLFVEWAAGGIATSQPINDLQRNPDARRVLGAFAGDFDFQRFEMLAFFGEDADDVGGGAGAEGHKEHLHGAGGGVGIAVGVEGDAVAGGSRAEKSFFAGPADSGSLHGASRERKRNREERERKFQI